MYSPLSLSDQLQISERSFRKFIKPYLQSTREQVRFNNLSIISIENTIARQIDYEEIVKDFNAKMTRKVQRK